MIILFRAEPEYTPNQHQVTHATGCSENRFQLIKNQTEHEATQQLDFIWAIRREGSTQRKLLFGKILLFKTNYHSFTATSSTIFTFIENLFCSLAEATLKQDPYIARMNADIDNAIYWSFSKNIWDLSQRNVKVK